MRKDGGYSCRSVDGHDAGANLTKAIKKTLHDAFPAVVEASGSAAAMAAALDVVARGGRILVIGDYGRAKAAFAWNTLLHREITLVGSNASAGAWPAAVRIATDKGFPLGRLVSRQFPAKRFAEAFELVRNSRDVVKVVLRWDRS
jgi:threonine dehydrogenase-like Zn-dependent dehydrogenase